MHNNTSVCTILMLFSLSIDFSYKLFIIINQKILLSFIVFIILYNIIHIYLLLKTQDDELVTPLFYTFISCCIYSTCI